MNQTVRRRRVFYIPGYDPMPPRRYRELYRREGAAQAAISGYRLEQRPGEDALSWAATGHFGGEVTETRISVLYWADLVQGSMRPGILHSYVLLFRTAWTYISSGALGRLMWLRKGPVIAALYPVVMLLAQALVALGFLAAALAVWPGPAGAVLGGAGGVLLLRGFRAADRRLYAYYLMHDYAFAAGAGGANPPELEARMAEFGAEVARALAGDDEEVLVVGHSSGAYLAVSVIADLIRGGCVPANGPRLSLMTLGQVIPMVSFLPRADRLRADLNYLSQRDEIAWVDVTAPGDGCSFALCDPVAVSGVAPTDQRWPLVLSAAFTQTLKPATWARLRWRFFRLHFQYLCAFDAPGSYDYFAITAGPVTLADRFAGRSHSQSRITRAASPHTSMAA